jgi:Zn-dependent protease with chaperone function
LLIRGRRDRRHRELAADRGAALLTGFPAGVAAALRMLSGSAGPGPDLRLARLELLTSCRLGHAAPAPLRARGRPTRRSSCGSRSSSAWSVRSTRGGEP